MSNRDPRSWFMQAQTAVNAGNTSQALSLLQEGMQQHPNEAGLRHAAGKIMLSNGDPIAAAELFGEAFGLDSTKVNFAIDQAIALGNAGRHADALTVLSGIEPSAAHEAQYCSTRGFMERAGGNLDASALWYDRALAIEPQRSKALQGRATVALERGESDAVEMFDRALRIDNSDPYVWHSKAQALDVEGQTDDARDIMDLLLAKIPQWADGLRFVAQLRLAAGEPDFTSHYAEAAKRAPQDPGIHCEWARQLFGLDYFVEASEVVTRARHTFPDDERLALLDAIYAGAAGDDEKAKQLYEECPIDTEERWSHEGRFAIRIGALDHASLVLERALEHNPRSIPAWAFRGIVWRLTDDPRAAWLHEQAGLVQLLKLHKADEVLPPAIELLNALHDGSPFPLGQSLRGGTQTRGQLFQRTEPELQGLGAAILSTIEEYRGNLPPADGDHPLLSLRGASWGFANSWSVRLAGGGDHHTAHIHPEGLLSSALYVGLPAKGEQQDTQSGWLEIGRPPPDLKLDLEPLRIIEPQEGHLALFPSTLFHGTRPFSEGHRMTVAFDIQTNMDQQ